MTEPKQIIIPLALFIFVAMVIVIAIFQIIKHLDRRLMLKTFKEIIASNPSIDPSTIEAMVKNQQAANPDLRKGMLLLSTTIATLLLGYSLQALSDGVYFQILKGIAIFPGLMALTYLGFHFSGNKGQ